MTEHPLRKEYSLRRREKESAVSNYVSQIVRSEVDQEEQTQHLNVTQKSSTSVGQDRRNQQQWSYYPEKEARIHHDMTNVSVISALVKSDEPTSHRRNNSGKATNHERINDQCRTGNKMINDGNQKDLNMEFYETSRCYDQSDSPAACGLSTTTFNKYTFLFRVLLCSANFLVLVLNYIALLDDVNICFATFCSYVFVNVQQMCACKYT